MSGDVVELYLIRVVHVGCKIMSRDSDGTLEHEG